MINQIEHNEVKSSQISENEVVGSKDSSGTIIHIAYFIQQQTKNNQISFHEFNGMSEMIDLIWFLWTNGGSEVS